MSERSSHVARRANRGSTYRLGVISPCYDPEAGSAMVAGAICRSLVALGHDVHVLTGFPHYPLGKFYPGYRLKRYQYEHLHGVHVHRVPLFPSHDRSALRRALTYLSFATSAATKKNILRSVDVWLVISSQATVALPAIVARTFFDRPYVLHIHDLWPETVTESGFIRSSWLLSLVTRWIRLFCDASYRRASAVAVTAPGMADALQNRGVPDDKLSVVPNWVDESVFQPCPRDQHLTAEFQLEGFVVMYAGNLGDLQGLETAIEAMRLLHDVPDLRLVFVGSGVAETRLRSMAADMSTVKFLGPQPIERMARLMAIGDVQLVSLVDRPLFQHTLPSKLQAAMACARPIIVSAAGDSARIVRQSRAGIAVTPDKPQQLASAMRLMHDSSLDAREAMGQAGRQFYLDNMSARVGSTTLARLVHNAAKGESNEALLARRELRRSS